MYYEWARSENETAAVGSGLRPGGLQTWNCRLTDELGDLGRLRQVAVSYVYIILFVYGTAESVARDRQLATDTFTSKQGLHKTS
jgi:hypothetical protein